MRFPGSTIGTSKPNRNPRSDLDCVSLAFRSRFACKWNAELTISKRVIAIFRLRFACLQNSPFPRILTAETQRTRGCKNPGKQIPDAGVSGSKAYSVTVMFLPASLRLGVSTVKLLVYFQRAPETSEPNGPRATRLTQIVALINTNLRDTLNFPLLA